VPQAAQNRAGAALLPSLDRVEIPRDSATGLLQPRRSLLPRRQRASDLPRGDPGRTVRN